MTDIYINVPTISGPLRYKVECVEFPTRLGVVAKVGSVQGERARDLNSALGNLADALTEYHRSLVLTPKQEPCIKCGSMDTQSNRESVRCGACYTLYDQPKSTP